MSATIRLQFKRDSCDVAFTPLTPAVGVCNLAFGAAPQKVDWHCTEGVLKALLIADTYLPGRAVRAGSTDQPDVVTKLHAYLEGKKRAGAVGRPDPTLLLVPPALAGEGLPNQAGDNALLVFVKRSAMACDGVRGGGRRAVGA
jgi:hypothetical protein